METNIEIVIDNSNSMGNCEGLVENYKDYLMPDGTTRMELVKKILINEIIPTINFAKSIVVSLFHSVGNTDEIIQPIIYNGNNISELTNVIKSIAIPHKTGGTPITGAIVDCIERLKKSPNSDRKIILITDGEETDKKDYKQTTKDALNLNGISCNIFIVGISLTSEAILKAKSLVKDTGGEIINLKSNIYDPQLIQAKLNKLKNAIIEKTLDKLPKESITNQPIINNLNSIQIRNTLEQKIVENKNNLNISYSKNIDQEIDVEENSELNESIRLASETFLFSILKKKYNDQLEWANENGESRKSYDFKVTESLNNSIEYYIECKGTIGNDFVFQLTKNEWLLFLENSTNYQLYFIQNALNNPTVLKIDNLMKWILLGKIVPYTDKNRKLKADRIYFTINQ
jgi:hypothetical protein